MFGAQAWEPGQYHHPIWRNRAETPWRLGTTSYIGRDRALKQSVSLLHPSLFPHVRLPAAFPRSAPRVPITHA
jgi:hypothetical protein